MTVTFVFGTLEFISANFINPYTGEVLNVEGDYYVNDTVVNGGTGDADILLGSTLSQFFSLEDSLGNVLLEDLEIYLMSAGNDILNLSSSTIALGDVEIQMDEGNDIVWANVGDDIIRGNFGNDILNGGPGNDNLDGGSGTDTLIGWTGNDTLDGGTEDDVLDGGADDDVYMFAPGDGFDVINETSGLDSLVFTGNILLADLTFTQIGTDLQIDVNASGVLSGVTITDFYAGDPNLTVETVSFDTDPDFDLLSLLAPNPINGTTGDDFLTGTAGNDIIDGNTGSDKLSGGDGDDTLLYSNDQVWTSGFVAWNVGAPDAIINGDRVTVAPRYRSYDNFDGGNGTDTIQMGSDGDALFLDDRYSPNPDGYNTARISNVEIIKAGAGDDIIDLTSKQFSYGDVSLYGEEGNDVLWGNAGNDSIFGGIGNDHLDGASGNDLLDGGAGDDKMYGWSGDDTFIVGEGSDIIYTGTGADQIIYNMIDAMIDNVNDFSAVDGDVIDLSDVLIGYDALTDAIGDFVTATEVGGNTIISVDADGGADNFVDIAIFNGVTGLGDATSLENSGTLITV